VGQIHGGVSIDTFYEAMILRSIAGSALKALRMNREFDHAANDSPRSGSSKRVTPVMWCAIVATIIAIAIWFALKA
jgi:hypothetical protein